ncbi:MAG: class D sortase [Chloroflexi bacterium]|nr:class D sortase [Chloroflexota bacterium]
MKGRLITALLGVLTAVILFAAYQMLGSPRVVIVRAGEAMATPMPVSQATITPTATLTPTPFPTPSQSETPIISEEELISATKKLEQMQNFALPAIRIVIPKISLDSKVVELGTKVQEGILIWETAPYEVGHYMDTANPGQTGNIVMSGHISTTRAGSVFKRLPEVQVGDAIILFTEEDEFLYQVVETKVVLPTETSVMAQTNDRTLTLITCVPDGVYTHRLIVVAKQV